MFFRPGSVLPFCSQCTVKKNLAPSRCPNPFVFFTKLVAHSSSLAALRVFSLQCELLRLRHRFLPSVSFPRLTSKFSHFNLGCSSNVMSFPFRPQLGDFNYDFSRLNSGFLLVGVPFLQLEFFNDILLVLFFSWAWFLLEFIWFELGIFLLQLDFIPPQCRVFPLKNVLIGEVGWSHSNSRFGKFIWIDIQLAMSSLL